MKNAYQFSPRELNNTALARLSEYWQRLPSYFHLYALFLLGIGLIYQLCYPIVLSDTDMWYHMDGGRYFWEKGHLPDHSFFSFLTPQRSFTNYYWGFQAIIAKVYDWSGYYGLIFLRSLLFFISAFLTYRIIFHCKKREQAYLLLILFIAYFFIFEDRIINLRPHLFSYAFILAFIYILEFRKRWAPALPILTTLWANIHGIEYPVPALITGAYFLEYVYQRTIRGKREQLPDWHYPAAILACAPAALFTPHGISLLATPFTVAPYLGHYIIEMTPLSRPLFHSVTIDAFHLSTSAIFSILFFASSFCLINGPLQRKLRISHFLMAAGGFILLTKGSRFIWEFILLVLPLLKAGINTYRPRGDKQFTFSFGSFLLIVLLLYLPLTTLIRQFPTLATYPFYSKGLPSGVVKFLQQTGDGGRLLTPPGIAGYVHWSLYPDYKVYGDLQMSLFSDVDISRLRRAYANKSALERLIGEYRPDYIAAGRNNKAFKKLIQEQSEYAAVFFDDTWVLYINRRQHPELANAYEFTVIDPFSLLTNEEEPGDKKSNTAEEKGDTDVTATLAELFRTAAIAPEGILINYTITQLLFQEKRYDEALSWAKKYINYHPDSPDSYYLLGLILQNTDNCDQAIEQYKMALDISTGQLTNTLHTQIGACSYTIDNYESAYNHLWKGANPFRAPTDENLYQLAFSAFQIGKPEEAEMLLHMLLNQAESDGTYKLPAEELLQTVQQRD